jgi:hypothetical protein
MLLPCGGCAAHNQGLSHLATTTPSSYPSPPGRIQRLRGEADNKALLLLDELGTGTDPTEGAVLGTALLKRLVRGGVGAGALTLATTHHSTMTSLKFEDPRFENASVEFDDQALAPTYKLLWGIPGEAGGKGEGGGLVGGGVKDRQGKAMLGSSSSQSGTRHSTQQTQVSASDSAAATAHTQGRLATLAATGSGIRARAHIAGVGGQGRCISSMAASL